MSTGVEIVGFFLGVASWLLTGACITNDFWKVSSFSGSVIISSRQYQNLWHSCAEDSTGISNCRDFESLLALPDYVQGCRALMIIALLLGLASIIVAVLGLKCTKLGNTSREAKGKIALTGGSLFILSGLCTLSAVSWYAGRIVQEFYDPFYGGIKFELGAGLYMGWGAAALAILGGGLLCCSCKMGTSALPQGGYTYNYSAQGPTKTIYRTAPMSESGSAKAYV
ncbi:claudin 15-like b isoform X2 [Alosa sapidissima]|uniref:claudin 15-like b isoform X2 n=2 Tax=Alosa TaxID=34772 RepID=UPI001C097A74|nr:claudin 15-like b isoform X2 [Alosa sapidissima]